VVVEASVKVGQERKSIVRQDTLVSNELNDSIEIVRRLVYDNVIFFQLYVNMISVDVEAGDVRLKKYERVNKGNVCQLLKSVTDLIKIYKEFCFLTCLKADDWTK
jgi:hypothetical protein